MRAQLTLPCAWQARFDSKVCALGVLRAALRNSKGENEQKVHKWEYWAFTQLGITHESWETDCLSLPFSVDLKFSYPWAGGYSVAGALDLRSIDHA